MGDVSLRALLNEIFNMEGSINWKNKYKLIYIEAESNDPDREWYGYEILEIFPETGYIVRHRDASLICALEELILLIENEKYQGNISQYIIDDRK